MCGKLYTADLNLINEYWNVIITLSNSSLAIAIFFALAAETFFLDSKGNFLRRFANLNSIRPYAFVLHFDPFELNQRHCEYFQTLVS